MAKKINAFQLADKVGRRSKAYALNRDTAVKASEDMLTGMDTLARNARQDAKMARRDATYDAQDRGQIPKFRENPSGKTLKMHFGNGMTGGNERTKYAK